MPADDAEQPHTVEPHTARTESDIRRGGRYMRYGGATAAIIVVFVDILCQYLPGGTVLPSGVVFVPSIAAALIIAAGMWELADQPRRALDEINLANQQVAMKQIAAVPEIQERTERIEQAIDAIAKYMPDVLDRENWRGFNAAVREGFGQTGTDGARPVRGTHLGLVAPDHRS